MNPLPLLSLEVPPWLAAARQPFHANYYAFFSSVIGGIVTEPLLMTVPVDDHLVHRGDGVFETLKCVDGRLYLGREHLARLFKSAERIGLKPLWTADALADIVKQTIQAGGHRDCLVRLLLSRGSGSMGVSPYDCPRPGLYVLAHSLPPPFMDVHPTGARVRSSAVPVKAGFLATVKSCNYLPNVLMKKEAVDAGVDFTVSVDERGHLAEGATENIGLLSADGELLVPKLDRMLAGTTMLRVLELARPLVARGDLAKVRHADLTLADLELAQEVFIFGTTPDVTAVVEFDGRHIGDGKPGPVWRLLSDLLLRDLHQGRDHHLPVF